MNSRKNLSPKLGDLARQIGAVHGREYWQCLEELADTEAFQELMRQEFPALADVWPDALNRRKFLALMGASLALAGISGCSVKPAPPGTIVPYVHPPEEVIPGVPLFYATTMVHGGEAVGLLVESHEGRPTKVEGNPEHPASRGATNIFHQASVLTLYDPARSQTVLQGDQIRAWADVDAAIQAAMASQNAQRGAGLRLLTETVISPTLGWQIETLLQKYPEAKWHQYEPVNNVTSYRAAQAAFGEPLDAVYNFAAANVVLSLDADFLATQPGHLRYANDFMSRRRVRTTARNGHSAEMNRLYVVEPAVSCTGAKADHRLAVRMQEVESIAAEIAAGLGVANISSRGGGHNKWTAAVARDLAANAGNCLVLAGHRQPPAVHLLAHVINQHLGNIGQTVNYTRPVAYRPVDQLESLAELLDDMERGAVEVLFIFGGNPVYNAPADMRFAAQLRKVPQSFHLALYEDATSRACTWHVPEAHYLEAWSDGRAFDGTASIAQPLIEPLYHGRSAHELVAALDGQRDVAGRQIVQSYWRELWATPDATGQSFDEFWQTSLHDGIIRDTAFAPSSPQFQDDWQSHLRQLDTIRSNPQTSSELELIFQEDPSIYDGRYAMNGWLQELPKPVTKLTWDNAAIMSPRTAAQLDLKYVSYSHGGEHGGYDVPEVIIRVGEREVHAPVWIMPGHADGAVTVYLGYGQKLAARANGEWQQTLGFNAYDVRTSSHLWSVAGVELIKLETTYPLACTQAHHLMGEREIIRSATLVEYQENPRQAAMSKEHDGESTEAMREPTTQYPPFDYEPPLRKWGMSIDTTTCIGCNACVVACQAENNIPVVGKEQVLFGREMHWLRVDRYLHGSLEEPDEFYFQPVPCMHCEHAPCEYVCPVAATVHSADGLNEMIYNRCVGTRFCSNNCPYKVRRFNFLAYADFETVPLRLQYNPDVTVRSRGVMEKCTYCVQRIRQGEIDAESAQRPMRDGEVLTACQAACPTQAIVFGDMNDPHSAVKQCKDSPLDYALLAELNTFPRTTYLAALRNPNPDLDLGEHG